jgi:hypothetical protein
MTAEELASRAIRQSAEQDKNRTGAFVLFEAPATMRYKEIK